MIVHKKSYGQHFLKDDSLVQKIVTSADIGSDDLVVEVGPGRGALTSHLPQDRLVLIEADRDLIDELCDHYPGATIVHADATRVDFDALVGDRAWVLIGNLPYNAANAIMMHALRKSISHPERSPVQSNESKDLHEDLSTRTSSSLKVGGLKRLVVMVQKEVADRMMAPPGSNRSILSVAVQLYGTPTKIMDVKPGSFQPPPRVQSSVIRLDIHPKIADPERILRVVRAGFSSRRKQLHKNLEHEQICSSVQAKTALQNIGIQDDIRAQDLSVQQWIEFADLVL